MLPLPGEQILASDRMRFFLVYAFAFFLNPNLTFSQGETPNFLLNGYWSFETDLYKTGETKGFPTKSFDDSSWDSLAVPGNWDLKNEYAYYVGDAW